MPELTLTYDGANGRAQSWNHVQTPLDEIKTLINTTGLDYYNIKDDGIRASNFRAHAGLEANRFKVRNNSGSTIAINSLIYVTGTYSDGTDSYPTIAKADSSVSLGSNFEAMGILSSSVDNNADGTALLSLEVGGLDTSGSTVGNPVYLSTTAGGWTLTKPTSLEYIQVVGRVSVVHASTGRIVFDLSGNRESIVFGTAGGYGIWLDNDRNSGIGSAADNDLSLLINGADKVRITSSTICPHTTNDLDLGESGRQFKDLYIDGTANIDSLTLSSGATVTAILDEDDLSGNSATSLATQQSIKAYVDARILTEDTIAELNDTDITSPGDASLLIYDTGTSTWRDYVVSGDITISDTGVAAIQANSVALSTDTTGDYVQNITAGTGLTSTGATSGENIAHSLSVDASQTQITSVGTLGSLTVSGDVAIDTNTLFVDVSDNAVAMGTTVQVGDARLTVQGEDAAGHDGVYSAQNGALGFCYVANNARNDTSLDGGVFRALRDGTWVGGLADTGIGGYFGIYGVTDAAIMTGTSQTVRLYADDTTGHIGIGTGTAAPDCQLSLYRNDTSTANSILVQNAGGGDASIRFEYVTLQAWALGLDGTDNTFKISESGDFSSNNHFVIDTSGKVGIGVAAPDGTGPNLHIQTSEISNLTADGDADNLVVEQNGRAGISILSADDQGGKLLFGSASDNAGAQLAWYHNDDLFYVGTTHASGELSLRTGNNVDAVRIDSNGFVGINTDSPDEELHVVGQVEFTQSGDTTSTLVENTHASYASPMNNWTAARAATDAYEFLRAWSNYPSSGDLEFRLKGDGNAYADGAWNDSGADYQEFFESSTGAALEVGVTVVMVNDKVRASTSDDSADEIIGVVRPKADNKNSAVVGNTAWNHWTEKYLTDDWGVYLREDVEVWTYTENGEETAVYAAHQANNWTPPEGAVKSTQSVRKLNPNFNPAQNYQPREDRAEWNLIGLLGQIQIKKGETVNPRWVKMKDISGTVELWYCR